jgi:lipopolysaccharide export system protein LptA
MSNHRKISLLLAAGPLLLLPGPAGALPEDKDKPIQLEADRGQWDQRAGTSYYEGNVVIIQGTLNVKAETATVYMKDDRFQRIDAAGKPVVIRYKPSLEKEELHATSLNAQYDAIKELIILTNNAKVTQAGDTFTGDYIEYELKTDMVRARSDKGNRIQITIQPKSERARRRPGGGSAAFRTFGWRQCPG